MEKARPELSDGCGGLAPCKGAQVSGKCPRGVQLGWGRGAGPTSAHPGWGVGGGSCGLNAEAQRSNL